MTTEILYCSNDKQISAQYEKTLRLFQVSQYETLTCLSTMLKMPIIPRLLLLKLQSQKPKLSSMLKMFKPARMILLSNRKVRCKQVISQPLQKAVKSSGIVKGHSPKRPDIACRHNCYSFEPSYHFQKTKICYLIKIVQLEAL